MIPVSNFIPVFSNDQLIFSGVCADRSAGFYILKCSILVDDKVINFSKNFPYAANIVTPLNAMMPLCDGYLISASIEIQTLRLGSSQYFGTISIGRKINATGSDYISLVHGSFSNGHPLIYCNGSFSEFSNFSNYSYWDSLTSAAGSNLTKTYDANCFNRPIFFRFTLVTDANAHDRNIHVYKSYSTYIANELYVATIQAASETKNYIFQVGLQSEYQVLNTIHVPFLFNSVPGSFALHIDIEGIQAGDQITAGWLFYENIYF